MNQEAKHLSTELQGDGYNGEGENMYLTLDHMDLLSLVLFWPSLLLCFACAACHQKLHNMERLGTNVSLDAMEMQCQSWSDRRLTCGTSYWYVVLLVWSSYRISPQQASFPVTAVDAIDEETEQKVTPRSSHMAAASKWYTISEPFSYQSFEEPIHSWESTPKDSGVCAGMPYHASSSPHMIWYCTLESSRACDPQGKICGQTV